MSGENSFLQIVVYGYLRIAKLFPDPLHEAWGFGQNRIGTVS
jgi:hypothetical protein